MRADDSESDEPDEKFEEATAQATNQGKQIHNRGRDRSC
jgi:hypothetical protein